MTSRKGLSTCKYSVFEIIEIILVRVLVVIAIVAIIAFKDKLQQLWDAIASGINSL